MVFLQCFNVLHMTPLDCVMPLLLGVICIAKYSWCKQRPGPRGKPQTTGEPSIKPPSNYCPIFTLLPMVTGVVGCLFIPNSTQVEK